MTEAPERIDLRSFDIAEETLTAMIQRVVERVRRSQLVTRIVVATDEPDRPQHR